MSAGVVYQLSHPRCAELLTVSLWSLRQHYDGPITVMVTRDCHMLATRIARDVRLGIDLQRLVMFGKHGRHDHRQSKVLSWLQSPYQQNLFIDADTAIQSPIYELLDYSGLGLTRLADCRLCESRDNPYAVRIWEEVCNYQRLGPGARRMLCDLQADMPYIVNTGVVLYSQNHPALWEHHHLILVARLFGRRMSDEAAMHLVLPHTNAKFFEPRWNSTFDQRTNWQEQSICHFAYAAWFRHPAGRACFRHHLREALKNNAGGMRRWIGQGCHDVLRLLPQRKGK
jgi:hypothetical protein